MPDISSASFLNQVQVPAAGTTRSTSSTTGSSQLGKQDFLKLLMAQMRNQDPMKPSDGMQFVGQLAQFQQLETGLNTAKDIAAIREQVELLTKSDTES